MKKINFQLVSIVLIALALRLYNLGIVFLGTDEAKTALGVDFPHSFFLPSLSLLSQSIFGVNNFAVRLPFALFGVLIVLVFYFIGKELFDTKKGLIMAFLATFLPVNVILSRTAFLDIALVFSWVLILFFWVKYEKEKKDINLFLLFLALLISPWFKIQAIYLCIALFIYLLVIYKGKFWQDKRFYLMVLAGIPFCFYFLSQPQQIYDMVHYTGDEVGSNVSGVLEVFSIMWQSYGFLLIFILGGAIEMIRRKDLKKNGGFNLFLLFFSALIFLVFLTTPKRMYYYVMFDIAAVFFSAYFLFYFAKKRWLAILLMGLVVFNFIFTFSFLNNNSFVTSPQNEYELCDKLNTLIVEIPDPKSVFLDTNFGFTYKWCARHKIKKIDNFFNKEINEKTNVLLLLNNDTFIKNQEALKDFSVEDYQDVKILTRTK